VFCSSLFGTVDCVLSQESENTALTIAAFRGHDEVVVLLLQHGTKIDHQVSTADMSGRLCVMVAVAWLRLCAVYASV